MHHFTAIVIVILLIVLVAFARQKRKCRLCAGCKSCLKCEGCKCSSVYYSPESRKIFAEIDDAFDAVIEELKKKDIDQETYRELMRNLYKSLGSGVCSSHIYEDIVREFEKSSRASPVADSKKMLLSLMLIVKGDLCDRKAEGYDIDTEKVIDAMMKMIMLMNGHTDPVDTSEEHEEVKVSDPAETTEALSSEV